MFMLVCLFLVIPRQPTFIYDILLIVNASFMFIILSFLGPVSRLLCLAGDFKFHLSHLFQQLF